MKILLSFLQDTGAQPHAIPAYRFWSYYIKNGINEAGMQYTEVPGLDWAAGLVPYERDPALQTWKEQAWQQTINYIKANQQHIDIFICYLYPKQINTEAIKQIRKMGIPCVNFYCDNVRSFTKVPPEFKVFDLIWVPEYEALKMYQMAKVPHIHLPMPMWVDAKYRTYPQKQNDNMLFIGSKDNLRAALLADVITAGLPIEIRGNGWDNHTLTGELVNMPTGLASKIKNQVNLLANRGITGFAAYHANRYKKSAAVNIPAINILPQPGFDDYITLSRESGVTIGINRVAANSLKKGLVTYSRLRDIEAPMLGACYLAEYTEGLPHLYELGKEIESYTSAQEMVDKCREIMRSESKQKEMRTNAQRKALAQHSIPASLSQIKARIFK